MKSLIKYNNFKISLKESRKWTLDELFAAMDHKFLDKKFIAEVFSDVIDDFGYSLGFKGKYNHDWVFPNGYKTISDVDDIHQRYKLKGFFFGFL